MYDQKVKALNSILKNDVNLKIKKEQLSTKDTHVDLEIHTNVEIIANKKVKLCLLINVLISVACITGSLLMVHRMHMELLQVQSRILLLNEKISYVCKSVENVQNTLSSELKQERKENSVINQQILYEKGELDFSFLELNTSEQFHKRLRRANRRKKQASNRRANNSEYDLGALAVHFKGSLPEIHINDQGLIGPWYPDNIVSRQYRFPKFHLTEGKCSIEVTEAALYLIYAQVYYITSSALNSYSVYVRSEGSSQNIIIARCSAIGPNNSHVAEISCYTSTVYSLKSNDRIFIQQTEKNRTIILRDGHSFFGLVRLNNSARISNNNNKS